MANQVPTLSSFKDIYPEDAISSQTERWNNLLSKFEDLYDRKADFVSRSPGRVNIIGEHVDYSLYPCLPMAIVADVLLAVSPNKYTAAASGSPKVTLSSINPSKYPTRKIKLPTRGEEILIDAAEHEWSNYFKAGYKGASALLRKRAEAKGKHWSPKSFDVLVDGNVPAGGGLSSSAAFVCASALAVLKANGEKNIDKTELVELAIVSERAVGVNSGGLDQAASVLSLRDSALLVDFHPTLDTTPLSLPTNQTPPLVFLIAQSHVVSDKHVTGPIHYNLRVVECTLAALFLSSIFSRKLAQPINTSDASPLGISLRGFQDAYFGSQPAADHPSASASAKPTSKEFAQQLNDLLDLVEDYMPQSEGYTREQVAAVLGITVPELEERYLTKVPVRADRFMLKQRALHVFGEALRVQQFVALLRDAEAADEGADVVKDLPKQLGELVTATQTSCRELYDCSCEELDELCTIAAKAGAYGGRLTGAGWGGCSVFLVPEDKVERVRQAWDDRYYKPKFPEMGEEERRKSVVVTKPGRGSLVWEVGGRDKV